VIRVVVKIGGSLHNTPSLPELVRQLCTHAAVHRILVVPGGGPFADLVRAVDRRWHLSPTAAHWMAILGMDQYAWWIGDLDPEARVVTDLDSASSTLDLGRLPILAPSPWLRLADPLPHSWSVTSDSIAAWIAGQARARLLVLCKATEGLHRDGRLLPAVHRQELAGFDEVDPLLGSVLPQGCTVWVVDGRAPERVVALLRGAHVIGTQIL
jgi:aspartokinase-like uncharacterized kinase